MVPVHLDLTDASVGGAAEEDDPVGDPPKERLHLTVPLGGQDRLGARLGSARDVVSERRGDLDLESGDVADGEAKDSTGHHHHPESNVSETRVGDEDRDLATDQHQREKEQTGVDVVVIAWKIKVGYFSL